MGSKRRRATSPSSSVSGDFDDGHHSVPTPGPSRKRRRLSNLPTVDPVSTKALWCLPAFPWFAYASFFEGIELHSLLFPLFCYVYFSNENTYLVTSLNNNSVI